MGVSTKDNTIFTIPLQSLIDGLLNPNQYIFCWLLHARKWKVLELYLDGLSGFPVSDLKDLGNRQYVTYINASLKKPELEYINNLKVTQKFSDLLYGTKPTGEVIADSNSLMIDDDDAYNELFMAYPPYITVSGGRAPGRTLDFELGATKYSLATKGRRSKHEEIMELLEWGKQQGLITMGLAKFIDSRQWLSLQQARESGEQGNVGYDNTEAI